jgi:hypothetical protein
MDHRPFSQACENNKAPILAVLREALATVDSVLEIGSGTGQHARYFAEHLPHLCWQPSDLAENLAGIELWRSGYAGGNLRAPVYLDVRSPEWDVAIPRAVFTANSLHIMPWDAVRSFFDTLGRGAPVSHRLCVYGPFNYDGCYTSESNANFDKWLAATHPGGGIRDFEQVDALAVAAGYRLLNDHSMPANNRLLVWKKSAAGGAGPPEGQVI